ncbi:MAG: hypothetical protein ACPL0C_01890 [Candidatus Bathyarchaeales archaeon]
MTQDKAPYKPRLSTREIALIVIFAALIAIVTRLPGIPLSLGIRTGTIEFSVP